MCTATFMSLEEPADFVFTVNRDESEKRPALAPDFYRDQNTRLLLPKDPKKGGTWIALSDQKRCVNLMNGAFSKHKYEPPYKKSRGLVLLDFLKTSSTEELAKTYDFDNIEPFTLLCIDWNNGLEISELRWDGQEYYLKRVDEAFKTWSASMTYSEKQKRKRREFFDEKRRENKAKLSADELWELHHTREASGGDLDIIIDRGELKTTSVSQIVKRGDEIRFNYEDMLTGETRLKTMSAS